MIHLMSDIFCVSCVSCASCVSCVSCVSCAALRNLSREIDSNGLPEIICRFLGSLQPPLLFHFSRLLSYNTNPLYYHLCIPVMLHNLLLSHAARRVLRAPVGLGHVHRSLFGLRLVAPHIRYGSSVPTPAAGIL